MKSGLNYIPYTYLIGWSFLDKWYYGCQYGNVSITANPKNLWDTYFTSSKSVKEYREKYGEPDVIQIRKTFNNSQECVNWENEVFKRLGVVNNDKWLNKSGGKQYVFDDEVRLKMSDSAKRRIESGYHPMRGKKHNMKSIEKMSYTQKEWLKNNQNPMLGKNHKEETKNKISEKKKLYYKENDNPRTSNWEIIKPNGEIINIKNLSKYCDENGLSKSSMCMVSKNKRDNYKGYRCRKIEA